MPVKAGAGDPLSNEIVRAVPFYREKEPPPHEADGVRPNRDAGHRAGNVKLHVRRLNDRTLLHVCVSVRRVLDPHRVVELAPVGAALAADRSHSQDSARERCRQHLGPKRRTIGVTRHGQTQEHGRRAAPHESSVCRGRSKSKAKVELVASVSGEAESPRDRGERCGSSKHGHCPDPETEMKVHRWVARRRPYMANAASGRRVNQHRRKDEREDNEDRCRDAQSTNGLMNKKHDHPGDGDREEAQADPCRRW